MPIPPLPFDTAAYDELPVSCFVYETVTREDGSLQDYRIVYGNRVFARDWERMYRNQNHLGAWVIRDHLLDGETLEMMDRFRTEPSHTFSSYLSHLGLHLHFVPVERLPAPFAGFFVANITDYEEKEAKVHFLRNIRQMQDIAILMRIHEGNRLEAVYCSAGFVRMMGCASTAEALAYMDGPGFLQTTYVEDRPLVRSMLRRRVSDEGNNELTIQIITKRGEKIWCSVHYSFIDDFRERYIYATYFDVTVLKEYEERLRSVYINFGNSFYQFSDKTLAMFRVNLTRDVVEEIRGKDLYETDSMAYPFSEMMELRAANYPIPVEREQFLKTFSAGQLMSGYLEGKISASQVLCSRRKDGRMFYVSCTVNLTRHPMNGDIIAFITEQECNSEKVRETLMNKILAQQFDMVSYLTNGHYGVVIGDPALIGQGSIFPTTRNGDYQQYLNSQVLPILSGTEEEKRRMGRALELDTITRQVLVQDPYVVNIACDIGGETFYKRFDFYAVDPAAKFCILLKSDTTDIQREQLRRNEQLKSALEEAEQANVAKTAFLSSMSHEIRTPMNAIIGLDNIALKEPGLPDRTREQLEKIGVSARHLLGLINDILDMSRIESGRMTLKSEEFSFSGFLEQINTLAYSQCQDKGLRYDCVIKGSMDEYYIGDDMKLKQVLINILGNAVKFTPAPGSVSLGIERTARFGSQSTLRFTIADTGIGMDPEYLPRIFEAFTQEDATATNRYGGSGLGMAITRNIVEMMNGTISVESEKGVGSTFTVVVPLKRADREDDRDDMDFRPQDMSVLVIDDEMVACEHARLVLEELGVSADTCQNGAAALDMIQLRHARREAYNLILVDWKMPEQDGVAVTRSIRNLVGGESAIIILTAYNWADVEEEAARAGVDGFMSKPLFAGNLLYAFRQAMQKRNALRPRAKTLADLTGRRILLAEDMAINAEIMTELLEMRGMIVEHAENGHVAVELFRNSNPGRFDAVLMDVRMPVMDGLDATAAIRAMERPDAGTVPIIAMTANAFDEDVQRSLQAGMNAHLSKPVEPERLYETLGELIPSDKTDA